MVAPANTPWSVSSYRRLLTEVEWVQRRRAPPMAVPEMAKIAPPTSIACAMRTASSLTAQRPMTRRSATATPTLATAPPPRYIFISMKSVVSYNLIRKRLISDDFFLLSCKKNNSSFYFDVITQRFV